MEHITGINYKYLTHSKGIECYYDKYCNHYKKSNYTNCVNKEKNIYVRVKNFYYKNNIMNITLYMGLYGRYKFSCNIEFIINIKLFKKTINVNNFFIYYDIDIKYL